MRRLAAWIVLLIMVAVRGAWGVEPAEAFIQGLRDRGYHELVLDYLERVGNSRLVAPEFAEAVPYHQGVTLLRLSDAETDPQARERRFEQAQQKLSQFVKSHPRHALASAARQSLAELPVRRARILLASADALPASEQSAVRVHARKLLDDAYRQLQAERDQLKDELSARDPGSTGPSRGARRARYVQIQMEMAKLKFERSATVRDDAAAYRQNMEEAAKAFGEIADKYRGWTAGLQALVFRGRCYQELQMWKEALADYEQLLNYRPETDVVAKLRARALEHAMECWCQDAIKRGDMAIERGEAWLAEAKEMEKNSRERDEDVLAIHWQLARAYQLQADAPNSKKHLQTVARFPGKHQAAAQRMLANPASAEPHRPQETAWDTFSAAYQAGKEATWEYDRLHALLLKQQQERSRGADSSASRPNAADPQVTEASSQVPAATARKALESALALADPTTSRQELNEVRFYLCYLSFREQRYYDAAVLGEFLARRYPQHGQSAQAAKIALTAYLQLYAGAAEADRPFSLQHVLALADRIAKTWPTSEHALEALNTLVEFSIHHGKLDRVDALLAQIPDTAPRKAEAEMKAGRAFWVHYLRAVSPKAKTLPEGSPSLTKKPSEPATEALREHAQRLLESGRKRAAAREPSETSLLGTLALAQILLERDGAAQALELLQDNQHGPYALCARQHPATKREGFAEETYRTTLRAQIMLLASSRAPEEAIKEVMATMKALEQAEGGGPDGKQRLATLYVSLARDLQQQLQRSSGQQQLALAESLDGVLQRVVQESQDMATLLWAANTWSDLGEVISQSPTAPAAAASALRKQAAQAYEKVLQLQPNDKRPVEPQVLASVRLRQAHLLRAQGDYETALKRLQETLAGNDKLVDVQLEAARTLSAWAQAGPAQHYAHAISGYGKPTRANEPLIWGWGKLGNVAAQQMQRGAEARSRFLPIFHEARLQLATAQFEQAMRAEGDGRAQGLRRAKSTIVATRAIANPKGSEWQSRYDALLTKIQKALGEPVGAASEKT